MSQGPKRTGKCAIRSRRQKKKNLFVWKVQLSSKSGNEVKVKTSKAFVHSNKVLKKESIKSWIDLSLQIPHMRQHGDHTPNHHSLMPARLAHPISKKPLNTQCTPKSENAHHKLSTVKILPNTTVQRKNNDICWNFRFPQRLPGKWQLSSRLKHIVIRFNNKNPQGREFPT